MIWWKRFASSAFHLLRDPLKRLFGGHQQLTTFSFALIGQQWVGAGHQLLSGKLGRADLGQIPLIKQRWLQVAVLDQFPTVVETVSG